MRTPLALPSPPSGTRVFFGLRAPRLRDDPAESAEVRARKRSDFFKDLGTIFMPGTPLMQAPLGLAAYLPVVLDPPQGSGLPDEVALIVYASREVYDHYRERSLSRRMYTRSHYAVFDFDVSPAGFAAPMSSPTKMSSAAFGDAEIWYAHQQDVDWQDGAAWFLLLRGDSAADLRVTLRAHIATLAVTLDSAGCDQVVVGCTTTFAAIWVHHRTSSVAFDVAQLVPKGVELSRSLPFQLHHVRGDEEQGVTSIAGASAHSFLFARELRHFNPS